MLFRKRKYFTFAELRKMGALLCGRDISVERSCRLSSGVKLYSPCHISGSTSIGAQTELGYGCVISDSVIGCGCRLDGCRVTSSEIGDGCTLGPFCNVRAGCKISSGCRIGDFVELKASVLGKNCKAAHLSYIGDAELGQRVNVGCGVVFANYDGRVKARTYVGDNVFIGCNSVIIAPSEIGDGAYIAASTCVSGSVPEKALAVGRPPLRVKENGGAGRYLND